MALKFMKTGDDSVKLAEKAKAEAEEKRNKSPFRFWIPKDGKETRITFVDGDLSAHGYLAPPRYYEHTIFHKGSKDPAKNYVCPEKTSPEKNDKCPLCSDGDTAALVALFTIIDHRSFVTQKGVKHEFSRKLFVAKPQTFELMNKHAVKRGGLTGTSWDVERVGDKSPAVGTKFDFVEKAKDLKILEQKFMVEATDPKTNQKTITTAFKAYDYEEVIPFRTGLQLMQLGLGKGAEHFVGHTTEESMTTGDEPDYSDNL